MKQPTPSQKFRLLPQQKLSAQNIFSGLGLLLLAILILVNNDSENEQKAFIHIQAQDGNLTVSNPETILNQYASLSQDASIGATTISVTDLADLSNGSSLSGQDLLLLIQMQGATVRVANDTSFGRINDYGGAGNYEFVYVSSTAGNSIQLDCGLIHDYTAAGHVQVIRVPQYDTLTIESGASVSAPEWDGTTGGVVAVVAESMIELSGNIEVSGKGFRGGIIENNTSYNIQDYYTNSPNQSAMKGESVAGFQTEYSSQGITYGRGAIANGGGGGNAHNTGGGGGANGNSAEGWSGMGHMCQDCVGSTAWALDSGYIKHGNTFTTSSGGGRGGYSYGSSNKDALTVPPADNQWGGDKRRNIGGLGGRPLAHDPAHKLFFGGGGGAGDGNNNANSDGAQGGGLAILISGNIVGSGAIYASGGDALHTRSGHNDAPGGGGGGGTILLQASRIEGPSLYAKGGQGGSQLITNNESEGPGGGGGGGYIALPAIANVSTYLAGGGSGTSTSASVTEFPVNGATDGAAGELYQDLARIPFCAVPDQDGDGVADTEDLDDDNDGIPDWQEVGCSNAAEFGTASCPDPSDLTANNLERYRDASACSGGSLVNGVCPEYDSDQDGLPDYLDLDSDGDGLPDLIEAGGKDEDGNGIVDDLGQVPDQYPVHLTITDTDNDGWVDTYDNLGSGLSSGTPLQPMDTDGDGLADYRDLDSDNDGIPDLIESGGKDEDGDGRTDDLTDGDYDGFPDSFDPDLDGAIGADTGLESVPLAVSTVAGQMSAPDTYPLDGDGDGIPNHLDLDADQDGIPDLIEAQGDAGNGSGRVSTFLDADGDGFHDQFDADDNLTPGSNDGGIPLAQTTAISSGGKVQATDTYQNGLSVLLDSDKDGLPDWLDLDSDQDGIPDLIELGGTDINGDGQLDGVITDADEDGFADRFDTDTNNDGSIDAHAGSLVLADTDEDGTVEADQLRRWWDADGDGVPNQRDLDSDNDGLTDLQEVRLDTNDPDQDGRIGSFGVLSTDADRDGFSDAIDPVNAVGTAATAAISTEAAALQGLASGFGAADQDGDGFPNFLDIDADGDGILDWIEAQPSGKPNMTDGLSTPTGTDQDLDGIDDGFDILSATNGSALGGSYLSPPDQDADLTPDWLDENSDNDDWSDLIEGHDANFDGHVDQSLTGTDADGDGLDDGFDPLVDRSDPNYSQNNATLSLQSVQDSDNDLASGGERDWREAGGVTNFPVEWLNFTATLIGADVQLDWATAQEQNSDFFAVERSQDGETYLSVGEVGAAGNSSRVLSYEFLDPLAGQLPAPSLIYRLRQVDMDGKFEYSTLVEVRLDEVTLSNELALFPNQASTSTRLELQTGTDGTWRLRVMDLQGRMVLEEDLAVQAGTTQKEIRVSDWASGYYVVSVSQGAQILSRKLLVQGK